MLAGWTFHRAFPLCKPTEKLNASLPDQEERREHGLPRQREGRGRKGTGGSGGDEGDGTPDPDTASVEPISL